MHSGAGSHRPTTDIRYMQYEQRGRCGLPGDPGRVDGGVAGGTCIGCWGQPPLFSLPQCPALAFQRLPTFTLPFYTSLPVPATAPGVPLCR